MVYLLKYGETTPIEPKDSALYSSDFAKEFQANFKLIGTESVTFNCPIPLVNTDLSLGKIYYCFMDRELKYMLPSTFILTQAKLMAPAVNPDSFYYECEGIGINDLLYRVFISLDKKNISFQNLMIELMEQTRVKIPQLSNDYSYIADVDFNISLIQENSRYAGQIIEDFRNNLNYEIYLRPDLKLYANLPGQNTVYNINFDQNTINDQRAVLEDWSCGYVNPISPTTSVLAVGGFADSGTEITTTFTGTGDPISGSSIELTSNIDIDNNYILEPFDSTNLENMSGQSTLGNGWIYRYRIYDEAFEIKQGFENQIKFEVNSPTGKTYLTGVTDGTNLFASQVAIGFLIDGTALGLLVNGSTIYPPFTVKPFESIVVNAISADRKTLTVDSLTGSTLAVGDIVQVTGLSSAAAFNVEITDITGLNITISDSVSEGSLSGLRVIRKTQYIGRWLMKTDGSVEFLIKEGNKEFESLGVYSVTVPANPFIVVYNNFDSATVETVDNGVWTIGNVDLDYWFVDIYKFLKVNNSTRKIITVPSGFANTVFSEAEIDTVTKNGQEVAQINFYSPSILRTITQTSTITRLYIVITDEDFIVDGMRVLVNSAETFITDYFIDTVDPLSSYIDVSPALSVAPAVDSPVYINTSIPALGELVTINYLELRRLIVRECNEVECFNQYGFKEVQVDVPEINNLLELANRAQDIITDECTPKLQGNFGFIINLLGCIDMPTFRLPNVNTMTWEQLTETNWESYVDIWQERLIILPNPGSFINVTYQPRDKAGNYVENINNESVVIQDYSISQTGLLNTADGIFLNVAFNFGLPENTNYRQTTSLLKQFAVFRNAGTDTDTNYNIPCILKDIIVINETLTVTESDGFDFVSGIYVINFSGSKDFIEPSETLTVTESDGFEFVSGIYVINFSGTP